LPTSKPCEPISPPIWRLIQPWLTSKPLPLNTWASPAAARASLLLPWYCWGRLPEMNTRDLASLPRAHGPVLGSARLRTVPEDFWVDEILGFSPSGQGEHLFVRIRKRERTTDQVAGFLARAVGVA